MRKSNDTVELITGGIVLVIALAFVVYAYQVAGVRQASGYAVTAYFDQADGLSTGGDVRLSGIKVGAITQLKLDPKEYFAVVTMALDSAIELPSDTSARITSDGLLGKKYISLTPGGSEDFLQDGDEITLTQGSVDLMGLAAQALFGNTGAAP